MTFLREKKDNLVQILFCFSTEGNNFVNLAKIHRNQKPFR